MDVIIRGAEGEVSWCPWLVILEGHLCVRRRRLVVFFFLAISPILNRLKLGCESSKNSKNFSIGLQVYCPNLQNWSVTCQKQLPVPTDRSFTHDQLGLSLLIKFWLSHLLCCANIPSRRAWRWRAVVVREETMREIADVAQAAA